MAGIAPLPDMPVVVELLFVDEEQRAGEGHLPLAKGIYADLERQLQDSSSHVRRKSAFGALVARGASVSFLADETQPRADQPGVVEAPEIPVVAVHSPPAVPSNGEAVDAETTTTQASSIMLVDGATSTAAVDPGGEVLSEALEVWTQPDSRSAPPPGAPGGGYALQVPPIMRFPKTPPSRKGASVVGGSWVASLFDWWPSCTPEPCKALPGISADACKISVSESVADHPCLPLPARTAALEDQAHEAGLGGWPLSIPHAFAAFPAAENSVEGAFAPASASASALTSAALRSAALACFRKAAVEVDDEELTVILAPSKGQKWGAASSRRTPSTASTTLPSPSQQDAKALLPAFAAYSRLVYPLDQVKALRLWPKADVSRCWPNGVPEDDISSRTGISLRSAEQGPISGHVAEVTGMPRGATEEFTTLLALPSAALAKRLLEAMQRRPRRPSACNTKSGDDLGAVRCELHMSVDVNLEIGLNSNFAAVVRRGICEACHVGAERVRICGVRDAALERGSEPSSPIGAQEPEVTGAEQPPPPCEAVSATVKESPAMETAVEGVAKLENREEAVPELVVHRADAAVDLSPAQPTEVPDATALDPAVSVTVCCAVAVEAPSPAEQSPQPDACAAPSSMHRSLEMSSSFEPEVCAPSLPAATASLAQAAAAPTVESLPVSPTAEPLMAEGSFVLTSTQQVSESTITVEVTEANVSPQLLEHKVAGLKQASSVSTSREQHAECPAASTMEIPLRSTSPHDASARAGVVATEPALPSTSTEQPCHSTVLATAAAAGAHATSAGSVAEDPPIDLYYEKQPSSPGGE